MSWIPNLLGNGANNEVLITVNHSNLEQISSFWKWRSTTLPCLKSSWSQPGRCAGASVHYRRWPWSLHGSSPESLSARPKREKTIVKPLFQKFEIYSTCLSISFSSCCAHIFLFQEFDKEPHSIHWMPSASTWSSCCIHAPPTTPQVSRRPFFKTHPGRLATTISTDLA